MSSTVKTNKRILALDILRGVTIAGMIMVNNPGTWAHIYAPLRHAEWNGLTPTDLVFPFFMFIMGISTYISLKKYNFEFSRAAGMKILKRTILIFLIGMGIGWFSRFCYYWTSPTEGIGSLLESRTEEGRSVSYISSVKKKDSNELSFTVTKGFDLLLSRYQKLFAQRIAGNRGDRLQFYCTPFSDLNMLLNLLSMLDCLSFSVEGGGTPCVHVRFDNPELLQQLADSDEYHNLILDTNERIFEEQIELFSFFFGTDTLTDSQRWDFVEEYFTGTTVEELKKKYGGSRPV